jgi:nickel transport protein
MMAEELAAMSRRRFSFGMAAVAAAGIATLAVGIPAQAHSIWFAQRARQLALIYGVGADDLDAVSRMSKITSVTGYDDAWQPVATSLRAAGPIPVVESEEPVAVVAAVMDYGDWVKMPDGEWHAATRKEHPTAILGEHNFKYAVHINQLPKGEVPMLPGHTLQLVPTNGLLPPTMGNPITLKAFYRGKPAAGVQILTDYVNDPDQTPLVTGADGTITFPVRNQGLNVVTGIYLEKPEGKSLYDHFEHRATLTFVLPHKPE